MKKRKDIETFRGFACLIIVAFHFGTAMEEFNLISKNIFCLGNYAVDFFFILSAYFLWGKSKNNKGINLFKYRLIRLYPAYWLSVLETSIFLYSVNSKQLPSLKEILFNMTMLQNLWGGRNVDGVYWTLNYELALLFMIVLMLFVKKFKVNEYSYCIVWFMLCLVGRLCLNYAGITYGNSVKLLCLGSEYVSAFLIGICTFEYRNKKRNRWIILLMLCFVYQFLLYGISTIAVARFIIGIVSFTLLMGWFERINSKVLCFIGSISFEMYLIHCKISTVVIEHLSYGDSSMKEITLVIIVLLIALVSLALFNNVIARKIQIALEKVINKFNQSCLEKLHLNKKI